MQLFEVGIVLAIGLGVTGLFKWFTVPSEPAAFTEDSVRISDERRRMFIEAERHDGREL